jgi:hypothetical protein
MSLNKFVSLDSSEPINMRIKAIDVEVTGDFKTNTITSLDGGVNEIYLLGTQMKMALDPSDAQDLATKNYVDIAVAGGGGGSGVSNPMTENLNANGYEIDTLNAVYTSTLGGLGEFPITMASDIQFNSYNLKGANYIQTDQIYSSTQGDISIENEVDMKTTNKIKNLANGINAGDAINKGQLDSSITTLDNQIQTNTSNISTNTSNITNLQIQQATNTQGISDNLDAITATNIIVGQHTTDIQTNTSGVASNLGFITQNTDDIDTINTILSTKASIADNTTATNTTWSSDKITTEIENSSSLIDFTGLNGVTDKVNLSQVSTQPIVGLNSKYTISGSSVLVGQPVIQNFTGGTITATGIGGVPPNWKFIGIACNTASAGQDCGIVYDGFVTARYTTVPQLDTNTIALNNVTTNTTEPITNVTTFTDSGGTSGNYGASQLYNITFDAGVGRTINYEVVSLGFEHSNTRLYDRLGWQFSNDGVNYSNPALTGWHRTNITTPSFGSYYLNNGVKGNDLIGNVFTEPASYITQVGGSLTGQTNSRYVKFFFESDGSSHDLGWNIKLTPSIPYPTNYTPVPVDTPLYLDPNDLTKVSTNNANNFLVGYCAYEDTSNDSIFIHVLSNNA